MLEINCNNCRNLANEVDGCKVYGADPATATAACIRDGFKNAAVRPERIDRDKETYFRADFYRPICGCRLASFTYGRAWTNDGLSDDKRVDCPNCGQPIDWSDVPSEEGRA